MLAAANPVYGQYDKTRRPQENIGLPDSLLSRFDLLFIVLDQMDPENDRRIASHVLRGHRYRKPGTDMEPEPLQAVQDDSDDDEEEADKRKIVWQKAHHNSNNTYTSLSNKNSNSNSNSNNNNNETEIDDHATDVLSQDFLRKYIYYAKTKKPELTEEAREYIANRYAEMRSKQDDKTLPVTARSLETIIRLSSAHAKARLSLSIDLGDCKSAMDVLSFALYHEEDVSKKKRKRVGDGNGNGNGNNNINDSVKKTKEVEGEGDEGEGDNMEQDAGEGNGEGKDEGQKREETFNNFKQVLATMFTETKTTENPGELEVSDVMDRVGDIDIDEVEIFLEMLSGQNFLFFDKDENKIYEV